MKNFILGTALAHAEVSYGDRGLNFNLSLQIHPYFCMFAAKALSSLYICVGLPELSLLSNVIRWWLIFVCNGTQNHQGHCKGFFKLLYQD